MFTGLIEGVGVVVSVAESGGIARLSIGSGVPVEQLKGGESVAVDGTCLTVSGCDGERFWADVIPETLARTTLGDFKPGRRVNLERSLRVGDRLGGHWVQGHVDDTGLLLETKDSAGDRRWVVQIDPALRRYVSAKGSIALDGVSLTVARLHESGFEVALIPETLARTTLGERAAGDRVNVEVDLVARYLETIVGGGQAGSRRPGRR